MTLTKRILLYVVLPLIAVLAYPPDLLLNGLPVVGFAVLLFAGIGWLLQRGSSRALTLAIFIQGLNVIIRIMMFFTLTTTRVASEANIGFMFIMGFACVLSTYLVLRLDRADVRSLMFA